MWLSALIAASPLALTNFAAVPAPQSSVLLTAEHVLLPDGSTLENGRVLIVDGKIAAVGADLELPAQASAVELSGWLTPGLIAGRSFAGAAQENHDQARSLLADARIVDAFRPSHSDFAKAVAAGITSLVLAPSPENVAGGLTAVVKTHGGEVLSKEAHLALSFASEALTVQRPPTSASGAVQMLSERFKAPESGPFALAAAARLPVFLAANSRDEILRALQFAGEWHLSGVLVGAPFAGELAESIHKSGLGVIAGPLVSGTDGRVLEGLVALEKHGVALAFAVDAPRFDPAALRLAAALCVRAGMSQPCALRAMTSDAAKLAGVADRVGALSKGLDADLALWTGSPVDLTSQLKAVWIAGNPVAITTKNLGASK